MKVWSLLVYEGARVCFHGIGGICGVMYVAEPKSNRNGDENVLYIFLIQTFNIL